MLRKRILQALETRGNIDQRKLARIAGLSESSISRFLHGYEEANFEAVLKLVKFLFPEEEVEVMAEYVVTQKSRNARYSLEYCLMNNLTDEFDQLLENLSAAVNPLDKEWAGMYALIRLRNAKSLSPIELLNQVEVYKPKGLEMQILKSIVKGYTYFDLNEYHALALHVSNVDNQIQEIQSNFIRDSFNVRLGLIMNYVSLHANNVEKARYYTSFLLEQDYFEHVRAAAFYNMGYSYMYESYEKSMEYLELALKMFNSAGAKSHSTNCAFTIEFVKSLWKKEHDFSLELDSPKAEVSYVYYLIQKGEKAEAQEIIEKINPETIPNSTKAFYFYYQGLINNDKDSFYDSVEWFKKIGNSYHLFLPLKELRKLNEDERVLNLIAI